ncbi:Protein of unknown function [Pyronema omphalodes CBS 100304]|uniref:Uncharacterized protein n=1 Tax=Pyronema omphalodes (strain CBS 100304) TaxID=1076935 RepID=U4LKA7_PYROM|nr:Protein of unknown function [Pyronema omphalodes CBS 100304]
MTAVESQYMETSTCEAAPRQQSRRHHSTTTFNIAKIVVRQAAADPTTPPWIDIRAFRRM